MSRNVKQKDDQQWFEEHMETSLRSFDTAFEPTPIDKNSMELFVTHTKAELKRKQHKELVIFWLCAICIISAMYLLARGHFAWFIGFQAVSTFVALGVYVRRQIGRVSE